MFSLSSIQWAFYFLAVLTLFGGLGTIMSKNPIHSVLYLILTFFSLSAHYILMNAQFLAVVNIIVYAGAIMVLFLFVIMFLNMREQEANELKKNSTIIAASIVGGTIGVILVAMFRQVQTRPTNPDSYDSQIGMIESLGDFLYKDYILPFELVSVLFLVAMVGAVMLGSKAKGERDF
jgi:NADH-quinone oxidoreductase subunit J